MKKILFFLSIPFLGISQIQIGSDIDGKSINDKFGWNTELSSDGTVIAITANSYDGTGSNGYLGYVQVYKNQNDVWTQVGDDILGEAKGNDFDTFVSLSADGSIVAIGAKHNDDNGTNSGHVRVFENINDVWTQIGNDIDGEAAGDFSGKGLCLSSDGTIVAIGASGNSSANFGSGHVRVFKNVNDVWTQIGDDIDGEATNDNSGSALCLSSDGSIVAIGAGSNDGNGQGSGHVRIYKNVNDIWTQIGDDIDGEASNDISGGSVSLSANGNIVAIGASYNDGNGSRSGHVRLYQNISDTWTQIGGDIDGEAADDKSGIRVSLSSDGSIVAIGAYNNGNDSGHVRIYKNVSGVWIQTGNDIDGEAANDRSGLGVSLSSDGSIVAIGAPYNNSNTGHVRIFDLSSVLSSNKFILSQFSLHPNPTTEELNLTIQAGLKLKKVNVYNYIGVQILTTKNTTINLSKMPSGIYIIEIETNNGRASRQIVKN